MRKLLSVTVVAVILMGGIRAKAEIIYMDFDTLLNDELVNNYYNGGLGSGGSVPGPNYGVVFTHAQVLNEFTNNEGDLVSPPNSIGALYGSRTILNGNPVIMHVAAGFTTGISFNYSAPFYPNVVTVWSGLDATGALLATLNLPPTPDAGDGLSCGGHDFCPDVPFGVTFNGTAESVNFGGTQQIVYDDITLGSATPGEPASIPEPVSIALLTGGLIGIGAARRKRCRTA